MLKYWPANAGDERDMGLIPGLGRSLEKVMATHSKIPAWEIPSTEKPCGPQSQGHKESDTTWPLSTNNLDSVILTRLCSISH